MLKRIRPRLRRGNGPWILVSAIGVALLVTPFAVAAGEGRPLDGGARNPSNNASQSYTRETQIIANTSTYGTRQSNKSTNGGGAIYGCRSAPGGTPANNEPCVRASNLSNGRAFEFATGGTEVGRIDVDRTRRRAPFTTNATGVATGLNADQVDGQSASRDRQRRAARRTASRRSARAARSARSRGATSRQPGAPPPAPTRVDVQRQHLGCALSAHGRRHRRGQRGDRRRGRRLGATNDVDGRRATRPTAATAGDRDPRST